MSEDLGYQVTKLEWAISELACDRRQLFMLGQRGRRSCVLAMSPQGSPRVVAAAPGISISSLLLHGTDLFHATTRDLRVSRDGAPFRTLLRGEFCGIAGDGAGGVWAIAKSRTRKRPGAGMPEYRYAFFHSSNGRRFALAHWMNLEAHLLVQGSCSKGLLLCGLNPYDAGTLHLLSPTGTIRDLGTPDDEYFSALPIIATKKGTLIAGDEWRSTDMGKTWKRPKSVDGVGATMLLQTSTGVVVVLGETARGQTRILISRDDGVRFSTFPAHIKGRSTAIAELSGSLVVANGEQLVRLPMP